MKKNVKSAVTKRDIPKMREVAWDLFMRDGDYPPFGDDTPYSIQEYYAEGLMGRDRCIALGEQAVDDANAVIDHRFCKLIEWKPEMFINWGQPQKVLIVHGPELAAEAEALEKEASRFAGAVRRVGVVQ